MDLVSLCLKSCCDNDLSIMQVPAYKSKDNIESVSGNLKGEKLADSSYLKILYYSCLTITVTLRVGQ